MGVSDVKVGMQLNIINPYNNIEYTGEVLEVYDNNIVVDIDSSGWSNNSKYEIIVTVDNTIYKWSNASLKSNDNSSTIISITGDPTVASRRRYPRLNMDNICKVRVGESTEYISGRLVNISAGGFAFKTDRDILHDIKGKKVRIKIDNFNTIGDKELYGTAIRIINKNGEYQFGCRLLNDNTDIEKYVNSKIH